MRNVCQDDMLEHLSEEGPTYHREKKHHTAERKPTGVAKVT